MQTNNFVLYKHTSPTGKVYIGITSKKPEARWQGGRGYRTNEHFFNAILKYGWENFEHEIIASDLTKDEACAMEQALISLYQSNDPACGYNRTSGGEYTTMTKEARQKMSEARSGDRHFNYGKKLSEDHRRKLSEAHTGEKNHNFGKTMSQEQREKISKANRGQRRSEDARRKMSEIKQAKATPVLCVETGIIYPCVTAAAVATGTHKSSISNCCKGRLHYNTAGGYHWRWADNKAKEGR